MRFLLPSSGHSLHAPAELCLDLRDVPLVGSEWEVADPGPRRRVREGPVARADLDPGGENARDCLAGAAARPERQAGRDGLVETCAVEAEAGDPSRFVEGHPAGVRKMRIDKEARELHATVLAYPRLRAALEGAALLRKEGEEIQKCQETIKNQFQVQA